MQFQIRAWEWRQESEFFSGGFASTRTAHAVKLLLIWYCELIWHIYVSDDGCDRKKPNVVRRSEMIKIFEMLCLFSVLNHAGVLFMVRLLSPVLSFALGGFFLTIYADLKGGLWSDSLWNCLPLLTVTQVQLLQFLKKNRPTSTIDRETDKQTHWHPYTYG